MSLDFSAVPAAGIRYISDTDVAEFKKHGLVCKLVSCANAYEDGYEAYVEPTLYPITALEAAVPTNYNLITLEGSTSGRQSFYGQGAGRYPTAYNVVQDCMDFIRGRGFYCAYGPKTPVRNDRKKCYYIRTACSDGWLEGHTAGHWGEAVITEQVAVAEAHDWLQNHPGTFLCALPDGKEGIETC